MPLITTTPSQIAQTHHHLHDNPALAEEIAKNSFSEALFDALPDVVFYAKDRQGRLVLVNQTFLRRYGFKSKQAVIGHTTAELCMLKRAEQISFAEQDGEVLESGLESSDALEYRCYPERDYHWCVTKKIPLFDADHQVVGLACVTRDLPLPDQRHPMYHGIVAAVRHLHSHFTKTVQMADLAHVTSLSIAQVEASFQSIFTITIRQMLLKLRMDAALSMLSDTTKNIEVIGAASGYHDQSDFTKIFTVTVGMEPQAYRLTLAQKLPSLKRGI